MLIKWEIKTYGAQLLNINIKSAIVNWIYMSVLSTEMLKKSSNNSGFLGTLKYTFF